MIPHQLPQSIFGYAKLFFAPLQEGYFLENLQTLAKVGGG
jgi:hypothetical protein